MLVVNEQKIFCSHQCSPECSMNKFRAYISTYTCLVYIYVYVYALIKLALFKTTLHFMLSSIDSNNSNLCESTACVADFCVVLRYCLLMTKILLKVPYIFLCKGTATRNGKILHVCILRHTVKVMNFDGITQFGKI